jgi:hypothetical protein
MHHDILVLLDLIPGVVALILCIVAAYLFNVRYSKNLKEFSIGDYIVRIDPIVSWSVLINGAIAVMFTVGKVNTKPEIGDLLTTVFLYVLPSCAIIEWAIVIGLHEIAYTQKHFKFSALDTLSFIYEVADGRVYLSLDQVARYKVRDYYFRHFHERNNRVGVIRAADFDDMINKLGGKRILISEWEWGGWTKIAITRKNRKLIKKIFST